MESDRLISKVKKLSHRLLYPQILIAASNFSQGWYGLP